MMNETLNTPLFFPDAALTMETLVAGKVSRKIRTLTFHLQIFRCPQTSFYMTLKEGILHLACLEATDFGSESVQKVLHTLIRRALRHEALRVLPKRLEVVQRPPVEDIG